MELIKREKIRIQRECGNVVMPLQKKPEDSLTIAELMQKKSKMSGNCEGKKNNSKKGPQIDGYWNVIQSWSQCTLKCGGGKSFLQRVCIPPKNGGKNCEGESILSKDCNKKPCPDKNLQRNQTCTEVLKPIVKVMAFSNRPQRYTKCVIKEGDMFLNKPEKDEFDTTPVNPLDKAKMITYLKFPVRLIMNNRTLTVFEGEDYRSITNTFLLKRSSFIADGDNKGCFFIKEATNSPIKFCSITDDQKTVEQWDYDFNLFKFQCNYNRPEYAYDIEMKLKNKISDLKKNILVEVQEKNKEKAEQNEEKKMEKDVKDCNKVALKAIEKELNLEEMIRKEEILREKKQEEEMLKRIKQEEGRSVKIKKNNLFLIRNAYKEP